MHHLQAIWKSATREKIFCKITKGKYKKTKNNHTYDFFQPGMFFNATLASEVTIYVHNSKQECYSSYQQITIIS